MGLLITQGFWVPKLVEQILKSSNNVSIEKNNTISTSTKTTKKVAVTTANITDWKTYNPPGAGFAFEYPATWSLSTTSSDVIFLKNGNVNELVITEGIIPPSEGYSGSVKVGPINYSTYKTDTSGITIRVPLTSYDTPTENLALVIQQPRNQDINNQTLQHILLSFQFGF